MTKTLFASTRLRCSSSRGLSSKASLSAHWWQGGHGGVWGGIGARVTQRDPDTGVLVAGADPHRLTYARGWEAREGCKMAVRERVAAVTGAASGLGRATALGLSRQGARVALCDLHTSGLAGVAATIQGAGGQARMVELDVSNQEQAIKGVHSIVQAWGRLCVLVHTATHS